MSRLRGRLELLLQELRGLPPGARPEADLALELWGALRERYAEEAPPGEPAEEKARPGRGGARRR